MTENKSSRPVIILVILFALCIAILFGLNSALSAKIAENASAGAMEILANVLPDAKSFKLVYSSDAASDSALESVPATVTSIYEETNGLGYAVSLSTTEGYTGSPMEFIIGIDAEGKISGVDITNYPDTKDLEDGYPESYIGQDSALADIGLIAGVTYSSSAFKNAVSDGFTALVENNLIAAGQKDDTQLLMEQLPVLCSAMANPQGIAQYEEYEFSGSDSVVKAMKALNGNGCAYLISKGDNTYLAVCNLDESCRVYDPSGADVTDDMDAALIDECLADTANTCEQMEKKDVKKLTKMASDSAEITRIPMDGLFTLVTDAFKITDGDDVSYGFAVRPYGYSNLNLVVYYMLDENGAIESMNCSEFILEGEYFKDYTLDKDSYKEGFEGLTAETFTGDETIISGATVTSNAMKSATDAVFTVFDAIKGGNAA